MRFGPLSHRQPAVSDGPVHMISSLAGAFPDHTPKAGLQIRLFSKIIIFISQSKHMLWVLKRTVSMRLFF